MTACMWTGTNKQHRNACLKACQACKSPPAPGLNFPDLGGGLQLCDCLSNNYSCSRVRRYDRWWSLSSSVMAGGDSDRFIDQVGRPDQASRLPEKTKHRCIFCEAYVAAAARCSAAMVIILSATRANSHDIFQIVCRRRLSNDAF